MFQTATIVLAAGFARALLLLSRLRISEGAGKAGCQPHPMALCAGQSVEKAHKHCSHHRKCRHPAFPARRFGRLIPRSPRGNCSPSLHRTPCGSSRGYATLPSCNFSTSLGCRDHTALPYASCCGRQSRRLRSLIRTSTASAPRSLHNVPAAVSVHRDPACASDVGQRPSLVDRNDSDSKATPTYASSEIASRVIRAIVRPPVRASCPQSRAEGSRPHRAQLLAGP